MTEARRVIPERMDDPALDSELHVQALRGLSRINALSASAAILWRPLRRLIAERGRLRALDLACGGGDVTHALHRRAGGALDIEGCDKSPTALEHARSRGSGVRFFEHDVMSGPLPGGYDAYLCSLFLHHLEEPQAIDLLRRMATADALLVNDLVRCRTGRLLARAVPRVISRSPVVHQDAVRSVDNSFTRSEARALADRAGLGGAQVTLHWPFRFLLTWRRQ